MLDFIRSNAQSWGVKIAFGLIIIVFIFWGIGTLSGGPEIEVVSVNGQSITIQELQKRCEEIEQNIRQNFPTISAAEINTFRIKQLATQQLILETLVLQEANRIGLIITPIELRKAIESFPAFQNTEGKFDPAIYLQFLKERNDTPGHFESQIRTNLLINKIQQEITAGAYISPTEAYDVYMYESATRTIQYLLFPTDDYLNRVNVSADEIAKFYNEFSEQFKTPTEFNLEYLLITPKSLANNQKIDDTTVFEYYQKHKEDFKSPEQIHAQHIIIFAPENSEPEVLKKAQEKINQAANAIKKGEDFSSVAKKFSQDHVAQNGGDLGWFTYEQAVPAFADVAFSLTPGEISQPIQTPIGYHIIKLIDKKPEEIKDLNEVSKVIQQRLAEDKASTELQDVLENVQLTLIEKKDLTEAGKPYNLSPISTGLFPIKDIANQLELAKPDALSKLTHVSPGTILENPLITKTGYVIIKVKDINPESIKPIEVVENEISNLLKKQKANELAIKAAEEQLTILKNSPIPPAVAKNLKTSPAIIRSATIEDLKNPQLVPDTFKATPGSWLATPYTVEQGVLIAYVSKEVEYPSKEQWDNIKEAFMSAIIKSKREQMFKGFLTMLEKQAKITIKEEKIIN